MPSACSNARYPRTPYSPPCPLVVSCWPVARSVWFHFVLSLPFVSTMRRVVGEMLYRVKSVMHALHTVAAPVSSRQAMMVCSLYMVVAKGNDREPARINIPVFAWWHRIRQEPARCPAVTYLETPPDTHVDVSSQHAWTSAPDHRCSVLVHYMHHPFIVKTK